MSFLQSIFKFYINSSIHVALAIYAMLRITEIYFDITYNEYLDYFIFFGSIFAYNFVKYISYSKLYHKSKTTALKFIKSLSVVCLVVTFYYAFQLQMKTLIAFVPFGLLTLFYAVPMFFTKDNLRNKGCLKIFLVAFVWAGVTVLIPLFDAKISGISVWLVFVQRFLFVIVLIIPFDIRDLKFDEKTLQTLPQHFGIQKTKRIALFIIMLILFIEMQLQQLFFGMNVLFAVCLILLLMVVRSSQKQSQYYSSFWVEGIPILWWILLVLINK